AGSLAKYAAQSFNDAARAGISQEERNAWKQVGLYLLAQAQAHAEGNPSQAKNLERAGSLAKYAAQSFNDAARAGISQEERDVYKQAGYYNLASAKAAESGDHGQAMNLRRAAYTTSYTAEHFNKAAKEGISKEERNAYKQRGFYELAAAQACAAGDQRQESNLHNAAYAVCLAVKHFTWAAKEGISEKTRNAYKQKGFYQLEVARLWADGNIERAEKFSYQEYLEEKNRQARQEWYQTRREPERPPVWKGLP
ncbi:MAG: hypothetical protein K2W99_08200, partial [Chthoniobacterales bacterium]|nr:hypothetical protein [Chthoniobacterales bacterium]